ncbi:MAG: hypothetical protein ACNS61_09480 [Candidatus Wenzhouxiangella sp. M2_3B_020]
MKSLMFTGLFQVVVLCAAVGASATPPLDSSEQFRIDQVQRSLDNVDKDLERIDSAGHEGAAAMAQKGANRNLAQARDRLEQLVSRHPELTSHPQVASARERLNRLAASVDGAEPSASPAEVVAGASSQSTGKAVESAGRPAAASESEPAGLSRKQKFELQQIETTVNNAEKRLEAFRKAEREDMAALALKGAKGGRDDATDELETFLAEYPGAKGSGEVVTVRERIEALAVAIEQAESKAAGAAAVAASAGADATADAERVLTLRMEYDDAMRAIHGRSVVYSDSAEAVREALEVIEAAERAGDAMRPFLLEFAERYGSDETEIQQALDAAGADASSSNSRVTYNSAEMYAFLEKLERTREVSAETVAEHIASRLADIDDYSARIQQQRLDEAAEMVRLGQRIDPTNPRLNRLRGEVARLAEDKRDEKMARIDSAAWPDHVDGFEGPGGVDDLAVSIQEYLADDRDWGRSEARPQEILAVSVTGPWQVAAEDLFGRPIQWRLPVLVAITDDELRPGGIAQAFELSMVAGEGAPDRAPKSPPWEGFWVGDNHFLRIGELP